MSQNDFDDTKQLMASLSTGFEVTLKLLIHDVVQPEGDHGLNEMIYC